MIDSELWIARDGTDDGSPGEVFVYKGKPKWISLVNAYQGHVLGMVSEYRRKPCPIANGQAMRLVMDTASVVCAETSTTASSAGTAS